ncbi:hypothetical protein PFMALIP_05889 [Plasmodium falciparum MaliPS096_E11]|uniref:Uncharacterized protein n=1 Tax=Plasmodium falciparum MaliPS096_E11 TaxID=1036727 RepID=A0A024WHP4_PLAFA|nr:hypothetical protein PFMALIP_05889 [Plasmodium falciparum MaliPS096_E11]
MRSPLINRFFIIISFLVIGGSFYTDGEFNKKVVDYIRENICFYLYNNNNSSVPSVINYIKKLNNSVDYFSENDIYRVIKTLSYEERINIYKSNNDEELIYYYNNEKKNFLYNFPCFSCNLFNKCNSDINTTINPRSCMYLNFYLNLEVTNVYVCIYVCVYFYIYLLYCIYDS